MKGRAVLVLAAKLAFSALLLALVLRNVDPAAIVKILHEADPALVIAWYLLTPLTVVLSAWRWEILAPGVPFRMAFKYTWIGVFFGSILPGAISGDVAKGVSLALKDPGARAGLAMSIVMEKLIGLAALLVFFDLACLLVIGLDGAGSPRLRNLAALALALSLAAAALATFALFAAMRSERLGSAASAGLLGRMIASGASAVAFYRRAPGRITRAIAISMAIHVINIFAMWLCFRALHIEADLLFASIVYPVLSVMLLVPVSISGIGVRDATLAALFGLFGLSLAAGVALSWLSLLATIPNLLIGGAIQLWEMMRRG